jgi:hypothetical protein
VSNVVPLRRIQEARAGRLARSLSLTLTRKRGGWYELWGWLGGDGPGAPPEGAPGSTRYFASQDLAKVERYLEVRASG